MRNLQHLNRNLNTVLVLDYTKDSYKNYERNVIPIKRFDGEGEDRELYKAAQLLVSKRLIDLFEV